MRSLRRAAAAASATAVGVDFPSSASAPSQVASFDEALVSLLSLQMTPLHMLVSCSGDGTIEPWRRTVTPTSADVDVHNELAPTLVFSTFNDQLVVEFFSAGEMLLWEVAALGDYRRRLNLGASATQRLSFTDTWRSMTIAHLRLILSHLYSRRAPCRGIINTSDTRATPASNLVFAALNSPANSDYVFRGLPNTMLHPDDDVVSPSALLLSRHCTIQVLVGQRGLCCRECIALAHLARRRIAWWNEERKDAYATANSSTSSLRELLRVKRARLLAVNNPKLQEQLDEGEAAQVAFEAVEDDYEQREGVITDASDVEALDELLSDTSFDKMCAWRLERARRSLTHIPGTKMVKQGGDRDDSNLRVNLIRQIQLTVGGAQRFLNGQRPRYHAGCVSAAT